MGGSLGLRHCARVVTVDRIRAEPRRAAAPGGWRRGCRLVVTLGCGKVPRSWRWPAAGLNPGVRQGGSAACCKAVPRRAAEAEAAAHVAVGAAARGSSGG